MAAKKRVASKKRVAERLKAKTSKNPAQKKATPAARNRRRTPPVSTPRRAQPQHRQEQCGQHVPCR